VLMCILQLQYLTVLDIVNNLLLYVEPSKKVRARKFRLYAFVSILNVSYVSGKYSEAVKMSSLMIIVECIAVYGFLKCYRLTLCTLHWNLLIVSSEAQNVTWNSKKYP